MQLEQENAEGSEPSKAGSALKERVADVRYDPITWLGSKIRRRRPED